MFLRERKRRRLLEAAFGRRPDVYYSSGDMDNIRAWYDYRREREPDAYSVDDVTWRDLDMARVFMRIDPGLSTPGEQVLYDTLRHPALDAEDFGSRRRLIDLMEAEPGTRLEVQVILSRLGRTRRADLCTAFRPERRGVGMLVLYLAMLGALVVSIVLGALGVVNIVVAMLLFSFNSLVRSRVLRRVRREFDTLNFSVAEIYALRRIQRLRVPALDREMEEAYKAMDGLRFVFRTGGLAGMDNGDVGELIATAFMLDLICYEFLRNRLWVHQEELLTVFQALGRLDTAIAVASWRKSMEGGYAVPELSFSGEPFLEVRDMVHPLLADPVPNDLELGESMLLTGSNASGKSTYLRTALLNALLAQSLCTAAARSYRGSAFYLYSSMALEDDLLAGESYYVTEIRSIRRILEAAKSRTPVLCVVDEVLRGTNTAERIAASGAILEALLTAGVKCLAATHDGELCSILADKCRMGHFQETVGDGEMLFDYKLYPGPARSRNAIRLLAMMGFDPALVAAAGDRAERYLKTGRWERE